MSGDFVIHAVDGEDERGEPRDPEETRACDSGGKSCHGDDDRRSTACRVLSAALSCASHTPTFERCKRTPCARVTGELAVSMRHAGAFRRRTGSSSRSWCPDFGHEWLLCSLFELLLNLELDKHLEYGYPV